MNVSISPPPGSCANRSKGSGTDSTVLLPNLRVPPRQRRQSKTRQRLLKVESNGDLRYANCSGRMAPSGSKISETVDRKIPSGA